MSKSRLSVAVCGANELGDPAVVDMARALGAALAVAGANLLCGGGGGVMEAASLGFEEARAAGAPGGTVVAILPGPDRAAHRGFADVVIPTGLGHARNVVLTLAADAVILVGGGAGTLSEAALAWQQGKRVVALAASGGWAARLAGQAIDERRHDLVLLARSPAEAVALAVGCG